MQNIFLPADILLPQGIPMDTWSVVACDQYSSEPGYWERVKKTVGSSPSTLNMIVPEAYLAGTDIKESAEDISAVMDTYLRENLFTTLSSSFIYVERKLLGGKVRRGLVGALDLEAYDFAEGTTAPVRASENTVIDRLPPRITLRENAPLEMPHVMVLIDDNEKTVIESLGRETGLLPMCYDFDLMEGGGHITGYRVSGSRADKVMKDIARLGDPRVFQEKYCVPCGPVTQMIVGDGNHSLAAAKACWNSVKAGLSQEERAGHAARYALVELTNIHDESLDIEPIHRVVFDTEVNLAQAFVDSCSAAEKGEGDGRLIGYLYGGEEGVITVKGMTIGQTIGELQAFLDGYVADNGGSIDYIHGEDSLRQLAERKGSTGFLLPSMEKSDLFKSVIAGGVFPKKSFSMGHAEDKRFYLECRKIR